MFRIILTIIGFMLMFTDPKLEIEINGNKKIEIEISRVFIIILTIMMLI